MSNDLFFSFLYTSCIDRIVTSDLILPTHTFFHEGESHQMKIGVPGTVHKPELSLGFHWQQVLQNKTENCHSPAHALLLCMSAFHGVLESKGLGSNLSFLLFGQFFTHSEA